MLGVLEVNKLQVQMVPQTVLTKDDCNRVTVAMTIAMDTDWDDHDTTFGMSDGDKFIGLIIVTLLSDLFS